MIARVLLISGTLTSITGLYLLYDGQRSSERSQSMAAIEIVLDDLLIPVDKAPTKGNQKAPLTIVEFSEYECPFCREYANTTFSSIDRQYIQTGVVRYVFRNYPLPIHANAFRLAKAALCAGSQIDYWDAHDSLFRGDIVRSEQGLLTGLGLNKVSLDECVAGDDTTAAIRRDIVIGIRSGVAGTPTFFLGLSDENGSALKVKKIIRGARPFETFELAIEDLRSKH